MNALQITSPQLSDVNFTVVLYATVNDNGLNGQCPDEDSPSPRLCPLTNSTVITINWAHQDDHDKVVIASSASAAGVAGIAALGLIAAFRRLNRKAAEQQYSPWEDSAGMEDVVSNPLYEATQNQGFNPLFESNK